MENKDIKLLIESINNIGFKHEDLIKIALEYYEIYIKKNSSFKNVLNPLWNKPAFLQQIVLCVREGIILSTNTLSLSEDINFEYLLNSCFNNDLQIYHLNQLDLSEINYLILINFFNSLRKEIFSRIYSQNKDLKKFSGLSNIILNKRFNLFMDKFL